ncbi:LysE family translocator [Rhodovibrionaceae bacterium A322]
MAVAEFFTSPYLTGILLAYGAFMLGMFSPGPNVMAVIGTSMAQGRQAGKALALGVACGSFFWGLVTLFGLTAVITLYAQVMVAIKIAGAFYLLWLAFKAFRASLVPGDKPISSLSEPGGALACYRRGLIIQMTNPKAAFVWIAIMSLAMDGNAPLWVGGSVVIGTAVISLLGHLAYAVAFSTAPMVAVYRRTRRWVEAGLGAFFCFASYKLLTAKS